MDFVEAINSGIGLVAWYVLVAWFAFMFLITSGHGIIMFVTATLYGFLMNRVFSKRTVLYSGTMRSAIIGATYAFLSFPHWAGIECGELCKIEPRRFASDITPLLGLAALVLGVLGVHVGINIRQKWSMNRIKRGQMPKVGASAPPAP